VKHVITEKQLNKDLQQMGVAIENATTIVKAFTEGQEALSRGLKAESLRVSQVKDVQYGVQYIMATSASGTHKTDVHNVRPLDISVQMTLELTENPNKTVDQQSTHSVSFSV